MEEGITRAQRWVNRRLQFTHGYGAAMSPVTEVASDGRPAFLLKDVPPVGEIPLERPEVYYGLDQDINYIRNSVKTVVDAYHGTGDYYVSDPDDPLVQAYRSIFPGVFQPMEEMLPEGPRALPRDPTA